MKVLNRNISTPILSHYCPKCRQQVYNDSTVQFDKRRNCGIGKCPNCNTELEFTNTVELMKLLGY